MMSSTSALLRLAVQRLMSCFIAILMVCFLHYDLSRFLLGHYTSQILRHQFCFELRAVTPAPANLLGIVLCHYKHPLIMSWVLSLAYFDGAEKMPSPEAYRYTLKLLPKTLIIFHKHTAVHNYI